MRSRLVVLGLCLTTTCFAQVETALYNELISIASKHAAEKSLKSIPSARLGQRAIAALRLTDKFYALGQSWAVKFTPSGDPGFAGMARKAQPAAAQIAMQPTIYDFKVIGFSVDGDARIRIEQRVGQGEMRADARVDHIVLTMSKAYIPVSKEIHYRDGRRPLSIDLQSRAAMAMGFEAAPVDLPNLGENDGKQVRDESGKTGLEFHGSDLFARPVNAVWLEGEAWPSRVSTSAGTAVVEK